VVIACQNQFASDAEFEIMALCTTAPLQFCTAVPASNNNKKNLIFSKENLQDILFFFCLGAGGQQKHT